jgi:hypothetical protein
MRWYSAGSPRASALALAQLDEGKSMAEVARSGEVDG